MIQSFQSLHKINKRAKMYSQNEDEISKKRSKALYKLKYNAIHNWIPHIDNIELHYLNDKKYYCFYYDQYSFHIPYEHSKIEYEISNKKIIHNFQSHPEIPKNEYETEQKSLTNLYEKHQLNPNTYLPRNAPFNAYWSYLPI